MIAQMIKCPTCSSMADAKARFCSGCYTVFPSSNRAGNRRLEAATTNKSSTWKVPSLFLVAALLGAWFVQIDTDDMTAEPGSYRATARDIKRDILAWFDRSNDDGGGQRAGESHDRWFLDNKALLPCDAGSFCEGIIHVGAGQSAPFVIARPNSGSARIIAQDSRGDELLRGSDRAQLTIAPPRRTAQTLSIVRNSNGRWSIIDEAQFTPAGARAGQPESQEGL